MRGMQGRLVILGCQRRPSWKRCYLSGNLNDEGEAYSPVACTKDLEVGESTMQIMNKKKARTRGKGSVR